MNKVKLLLNLLLVPVYFTLALAFYVLKAFGNAYSETADAVRETIRMYK